MEEEISSRKSEVLVWFNKWISWEVFHVYHCLKNGDELWNEPLKPSVFLSLSG